MLETKRNIKFFKMTPAKVILLGFASFILIGAFLLCLPICNRAGQWVSFIDALFTSTSSVCVTGLMVYDVGVKLNMLGQFVVMILIQLGGLGFVSITSILFLLVGKKINYATRLTIQESLNQDDTKDVVKTVIIVVVSTLIIEFIGFLMLAPSMVKFSNNFGSGLFKAMFLSVSAFCNAGFDPLGVATPELSNLAHFSNNAFVLIPIMLLIVLGGIGFIVIIEIATKTKARKKFNLHTRVVLTMTLLLIILGAGLILALEWNNGKTIGSFSVGDKIVNAFFQSITTRTAGFSTIDQSQMSPLTIVICEILMLAGGSPASMAGGLKTTTVFILLLFLFKRTDRNGNIIYKSKKISNNLISKAVKLFLTAILLLLVGVSLIYLFENQSFTLDAILYETISALCTVGLSFGITPILCWQSKFILSILMYVGRIGMLTIPMAFKLKNQTSGIDYPEAKITVG